MSDPAVRDVVTEYLRRPALVLSHPNDVVSRARDALAGYEPEDVSWTSEMLEVFLTDELLEKVIARSASEADMWDACVLAVERFAERRLPLPSVLAAWVLDVLKNGLKRPGKQFGAPEDRRLQNVARDMRVCGAVDLAAKKLGSLDAAFEVVSDCLMDLYRRDPADGAVLGREAVKSIWKKYGKLVRADGPVILPMGNPIE